MTDYISRDDALLALVRATNGLSSNCKSVNAIKKLPAADVVERSNRTNADRIRSMTDEELAEKLTEIAKSDMWETDMEWWLEWLKKEVDDDGR